MLPIIDLLQKIKCSYLTNTLYLPQHFMYFIINDRRKNKYCLFPLNEKRLWVGI